LAQMSPTPTGADGFSDDLINFGTRHYIRKTGTDKPCYRPLAVKYWLIAGRFMLALPGERATTVSFI
jgi:hypothetical protein